MKIGDAVIPADAESKICAVGNIIAITEAGMLWVDFHGEDEAAIFLYEPYELVPLSPGPAPH